MHRRPQKHEVDSRIDVAQLEDILIVGGEDHKTGQEDDNSDPFKALEDWTRERFPMVKSIDFKWSGQVMEPVDYMSIHDGHHVPAPAWLVRG